MLNKKKFILACTLVIFFVSSVVGIIVFSKGNDKQLASENVIAGENVLALEEKASEPKDSEENIISEEAEQSKLGTVFIAPSEEDSEETAKIEEEKNNENSTRRQSLTVASRGSALTPRTNPSPQQQPPAPKPEPKVETPKPAAPVTSGNTINGYTEEDIYWLAKMIHAESRGEPYEGQVAVGAVILRRVQHPDFPNTVKEVIFDKWDGKYYQFSPVADGSIWLEPNETAYRAARDAASGVDPSGGALYFYNPAKSTSQWILTRPVVKQIGDHVFAL